MAELGGGQTAPVSEQELLQQKLKPMYKQYLEGAFRQIAPTKDAMELRKQTLVDMLDRSQELYIRGIRDCDLIYKTVIDGLGDMESRLAEFETRKDKSKNLKRRLSFDAIVAIALTALLAIVYVIVGAMTGRWHPTWLIMVGGIFAGGSFVMAVGVLKLLKKRKILPVRILVAIIETLASVFIFLLLQIVFSVKGSWMTFLAMVALIVGADTVISFMFSSKARWIELPIFAEIFCVMLYVILGISLSMTGIASIWHPGWILCLGGVIVAMIEISVAVAIRRKRDGQKIASEKETDEKYWTSWDD